MFFNTINIGEGMERFGEVLYDEDLKKYNTYKIGGKSKYIIKPNDIDSLIGLLKYLDEEKIKYKILGKGSNVILPDEDFDGAIILLEKLNNIIIKNNTVEVEAGCSLNYFINKVVNSNLKGLENFYGIPGTVGGAIFQNAGCYGSTICDNVLNVTYLEDGKIKELKKEDCLFDYRSSIFKRERNKIILKCKFVLTPGNPSEMKKTMRDNTDKRVNSQPLEYPNAGSVFRNPIGYYAGRVIEECELKNFHINDAYVSEKHANFIINKVNAKSSDIKELIGYIQDIVYKKEKIELELEQEIVEY